MGRATNIFTSPDLPLKTPRTKLIQNSEAVAGIPATYVAAMMDLQMADLLETTSASQIFSITGAPEIKLTKLAKKSAEGGDLYEVELLGLDIFDAVTMEDMHRSSNDVPTWLLDADYNELAFSVTQGSSRAQPRGTIS